MWNKIALALLIIGGINWGLIGIFQFGSVISRIVYTLVAASAVWCISLLFKENELVRE